MIWLRDKSGGHKRDWPATHTAHRLFAASPANQHSPRQGESYAGRPLSDKVSRLLSCSSPACRWSGYSSTTADGHRSKPFRACLYDTPLPSILKRKQSTIQGVPGRHYRHRPHCRIEQCSPPAKSRCDLLRRPHARSEPILPSTFSPYSVRVHRLALPAFTFRLRT